MCHYSEILWGWFCIAEHLILRSNDWWTRLAKCPQIRTWGPWPSQPMLAQGEFPGKKLSASSIQLPAECVCNLSNLILCFCISPHDSFSAAEFFSFFSFLGLKFFTRHRQQKKTWTLRNSALSSLEKGNLWQEALELHFRHCKSLCCRFQCRT